MTRGRGRWRAASRSFLSVLVVQRKERVVVAELLVVVRKIHSTKSDQGFVLSAGKPIVECSLYIDIYICKATDDSCVYRLSGFDGVQSCGRDVLV
jgi:hypothetical protein